MTFIPPPSTGQPAIHPSSWSRRMNVSMDGCIATSSIASMRFRALQNQWMSSLTLVQLTCLVGNFLTSRPAKCLAVFQVHIYCLLLLHRPLMHTHRPVHGKGRHGMCHGLVSFLHGMHCVIQCMADIHVPPWCLTKQPPRLLMIAEFHVCDGVPKP